MDKMFRHLKLKQTFEVIVRSTSGNKRQRLGFFGRQIKPSQSKFSTYLSRGPAKKLDLAQSTSCPSVFEFILYYIGLGDHLHS